MKLETRLFFRQLLNTNGRIEQFLDSDYAFVNRELATAVRHRSDALRRRAWQAGRRAGARRPGARRRGPCPLARFRPRRADRSATRRTVGPGQHLDAHGQRRRHFAGGPRRVDPGAHPRARPLRRRRRTCRRSSPTSAAPKPSASSWQKHRESEACSVCHRQIDPPGLRLGNVRSDRPLAWALCLGRGGGGHRLQRPVRRRPSSRTSAD